MSAVLNSRVSIKVILSYCRLTMRPHPGYSSLAGGREYIKSYGTYPSCSTPTCLTRIEYDNALSLCSRILTQVSRSRGSGYTSAHDNHISLSRKFFGSAVTKEELIWLAVPEGVRGYLGWKRGAFVSHGGPGNERVGEVMKDVASQEVRLELYTLL
jgi:hypothetical protein